MSDMVSGREVGMSWLRVTEVPREELVLTCGGWSRGALTFLCSTIPDHK